MSSKTVAIVQSNYIPWKGYFDLIGFADEFVLLDDVQYTRRDWRNRNRIKTPQGLQWLTIPMVVKGKYHQKICDTKTSEPGWAAKHWRTIVYNYARAAHFDDYKDRLEALYLGCAGEEHLSKINHQFLTAVNAMLGIRTRLSWSMNYARGSGGTTEMENATAVEEAAGVAAAGGAGKKGGSANEDDTANETVATNRLVDICKATGADVYLSGPAAKDYLDESIFEAEGIAVRYMDYTGYPEYRQLHGEFQHEVSILDLILNEGPEAPRFLKSTA